MAYEKIICEKDVENKFLTITMNEPERRNPLGVPMLSEICAALDEAAWDDDVKVVILKGAGSGFTGGHDMKELATYYQPGEKRTQRGRINRDRRWRCDFLSRIYRSAKPIVCQIHGFAVAGGIFLAEIADFAVSTEDTRFSMGPYRWGGLIQDYIFPLDVLTLGLKKIKELGYLGLEFSGKEAEEMGLVYKAVPADRLEEEVQVLAKRIALQPLDGLVMTKEWVNLQLATMGVYPSFITGYLGHALFSNIHYEPGEHNVLKEIKDEGLPKATRKRQAREQIG